MINLKNILTGIATTLVISLLTWIAINTNQVPELKNQIIDLKEQNGRQDELLQQEMEKVHALQIEIAILKATK
jgi:hypothetical protein